MSQTQLKDMLHQDQQVTLADGKTYTFSKVHCNAEAAIQERYNLRLVGPSEEPGPEPGTFKIGIQVLMEKIAEDFAALRFVTWQLLRRDHRELTEDEVGYLIEMDNREAVTQAVGFTLARSLPIPELKKKELIGSLQAVVPIIGSQPSPS